MVGTLLLGGNTRAELSDLQRNKSHPKAAVVPHANVVRLPDPVETPPVEGPALASAAV